MHLKWFERAILVLGIIGYALMFAGFAAAKGFVPEAWIRIENVSASLAVCTVLLLACELMACGTFQAKSMWMKPVAVVLLLFMFVSYQIPLWWYKLSGHLEGLTIFIKVVVPILTVFVFLSAALYVTRQRRRLTYI